MHFQSVVTLVMRISILPTQEIKVLHPSMATSLVRFQRFSSERDWDWEITY